MKQMRKIKLKDSSNVKKAWYDTATNELLVQFTSSKYVYHKVESTVIAKWQQAESVGSFFYHNIRNKYDYRKIG